MANADVSSATMVFEAACGVGQWLALAPQANAVGREKVRISAKNTPVEARTETDYDLVGNVTEVRSPRLFDSTDTHEVG
jgi:hypothetical protein